ncbi:hypothetical protein AMAG_17649 [Allomyces macrogynus ATCC 38327]|uniref:Up-regulated during septation protein 1 domain-containing protein n=1 Tax=Allomyces macrogynus (strain ATCC 38327) TaxID=578462 RepID=A0A0L0RW32_ALLM3|nr:hypothetical protein AMAG_17649 [Allomyces macrogynus ATCC 38327]|eukprot:KNE54305.1 hypothetical protein AMAG_17649 [Allomyces macrogynus ATCC 38327]
MALTTLAPQDPPYPAYATPATDRRPRRPEMMYRNPNRGAPGGAPPAMSPETLARYRNPARRSNAHANDDAGGPPPPPRRGVVEGVPVPRPRRPSARAGPEPMAAAAPPRPRMPPEAPVVTETIRANKDLAVSMYIHDDADSEAGDRASRPPPPVPSHPATSAVDGDLEDASLSSSSDLDDLPPPPPPPLPTTSKPNRNTPPPPVGLLSGDPPPAGGTRRTPSDPAPDAKKDPVRLSKLLPGALRRPKPSGGALNVGPNPRPERLSGETSSSTGAPDKYGLGSKIASRARSPTTSAARAPSPSPLPFASSASVEYDPVRPPRANSRPPRRPSLATGSETSGAAGDDEMGMPPPVPPVPVPDLTPRDRARIRAAAAQGGPGAAREAAMAAMRAGPNADEGAAGSPRMRAVRPQRPQRGDSGRSGDPASDPPAAAVRDSPEAETAAGRRLRRPPTPAAGDRAVPPPPPPPVEPFEPDPPTSSVRDRVRAFESTDRPGPPIDPFRQRAARRASATGTRRPRTDTTPTGWHGRAVSRATATPARRAVTPGTSDVGDRSEAEPTPGATAPPSRRPTRGRLDVSDVQSVKSDGTHTPAASTIARSALSNGGSVPEPLVTDALHDVRSYKILPPPDVDRYQREVRATKSKMEQLTQRLGLEIRAKDTASRAMRDPSTPPEAARQARADLAGASDRVERLIAELLRHTKRVGDLETRLAQHSAAVLGKSLVESGNGSTGGSESNAGIAALEAKVLSLTDDLQRANMRYQKAREAFDHKAQTAAKLRAELDDVRARMDEDQEGIEEKDRTIAALRTELEEITTKNEIQETMRLQAAKADESEKVREVQDELAHAQSKIATLEADLAETKAAQAASARSQVRELGGERDRLRTQVEEERARRMAAEDRCKDLENQVRAAAAEWSAKANDLTRKLRDATQTADELKKQQTADEPVLRRALASVAPSAAAFSVATLASSVDQVVRDRDALTGQVRDLTARNTTLQSKVDFLMASSADSAAMTKATAESDAKLAQTTRDLHDTEAALQDALRDVNTLTAERKQLAAEVDKHRAAADRAQKDLAALHSETCSGNWTRLRAQLDRANAARNSDRAEAAATLERTSKAADAKVAALQRDVQDARQALDEARQGVARAQADAQQALDALRAQHAQDLAAAKAALQQQIDALKDELEDKERHQGARPN